MDGSDWPPGDEPVRLPRRLALGIVIFQAAVTVSTLIGGLLLARFF
jgi:hypothetical protein